VPTARPISPGLFVEDDGGPRLIASGCEQCGRLQFPADAICPYCGSAACAPARVGPEARLYLFTTIATAPPGYQGPLPYGFGVVELAGGLRVVTRLTETSVERLAPGQPMRLVLETLFTDEDGTPVVSYAFTPGDEGGR